MSVLNQLEVLIVDDEQAFLDVIEEMLRSIGVLSIARAQSGQEASALLEMPGCRINCVLCDVSMPEDNGFGLLVSIRAGQSRQIPQDLPFYLVTSHADADFVNTAQKLGATGYLVKPVRPDTLRDAIRPDRLTNIFQRPTTPFGRDIARRD